MFNCEAGKAWVRGDELEFHVIETILVHECLHDSHSGSSFRNGFLDVSAYNAVRQANVEAEHGTMTVRGTSGRTLAKLPL